MWSACYLQFVLCIVKITDVSVDEVGVSEITDVIVTFRWICQGDSRALEVVNCFALSIPPQLILHHPTNCSPQLLPSLSIRPHLALSHSTFCLTDKHKARAYRNSVELLWKLYWIDYFQRMYSVSVPWSLTRMLSFTWKVYSREMVIMKGSWQIGTIVNKTVNWRRSQVAYQNHNWLSARNRHSWRLLYTICERWWTRWSSFLQRWNSTVRHTTNRTEQNFRSLQLNFQKTFWTSHCKSYTNWYHLELTTRTYCYRTETARTCCLHTVMAPIWKLKMSSK